MRSAHPCRKKFCSVASSLVISQWRWHECSHNNYGEGLSAAVTAMWWSMLSTSSWSREGCLSWRVDALPYIIVLNQESQNHLKRCGQDKSCFGSLYTLRLRKLQDTGLLCWITEVIHIRSIVAPDTTIELRSETSAGRRNSVSLGTKIKVNPCLTKLRHTKSVCDDLELSEMRNEVCFCALISWKYLTDCTINYDRSWLEESDRHFRMNKL